MRIGWVGLGAMGGPMAACLARSGHDVHGYDIAPGRAAALAAGGVRAAASIAAAVADADLAAIMVATPDQLDQVLSGPEGVAATLPAGRVVLIMATVGPEAVGRARPVLDTLARAAPVVGPVPGDGQRMKLVNQLLCGVRIAAAAVFLCAAGGAREAPPSRAAGRPA